MKTIGLLGGMSWESTQGYYKAINEGVKAKLGGLHSAKIVLVSVDFAEIEHLQHQNDWESCAQILLSASLNVQSAGADCLLICTNTMHKVAPTIEEKINIPLLHIADATGQTLLNANIIKVDLLGTAFTMEQDFYKGRLQDKFSQDVLTPNEEDRAEMHRIIYEELCKGQLLESSKERYLDIIKKLQAQGAQAVILGCTEIGLLVKQEDTEVKLFDTTAIHAETAVDFALS